MGILGYVGCYAAGLVTTVVFIVGFIVGHKAKKVIEAGGQPFVKTKEHDPIRNESVEAVIEQRQAEVEAWEQNN